MSICDINQYRAIINICRMWADKFVIWNAERTIIVEHLQEATEQEKVAAEREKKAQEEISCMKVELESARAELESVQLTIKSQEFRIKKKKHEVNRLRKKRDDCTKELEKERKKHRTIKAWLALADAESVCVKEVAWSTLKALSWVVEDYKKSEDFKNKILEGSHEAYWIGYADS